MTSDGFLWTAAGDHSLKRWNTANLSLMNTLGVDYTSKAAAFSRNGERVAAIGSGGLNVFQLSTGTLINTYPGGNFGTFSPSISADGKTIIYEQFNQVTDLLIEVSLATGAVRTIAATPWTFGLYGITPDASIMVVKDNPSGFDTGAFNLFRGSDGSFIRSISGNLGVSVLAFSPDSKLMALGNAGGTGIIRIFSLNLFLATEVLTVVNADGTPATIQSLAFSPDGQLLASGDANTTRIWKLASGLQSAQMATASAWRSRRAKFGVTTGYCIQLVDDSGEAC